MMIWLRVVMAIVFVRTYWLQVAQGSDGCLAQRRMVPSCSPD